MKASVEVIEGPMKGQVYLLDKSERITFGRGENCDYCLQGKGVSRSHFQISREGKDYIIKNLGSLNGVFINGERVEDARLSPGDLIAVGDVLLNFKKEWEEHVGLTTEVVNPEELCQKYLESQKQYEDSSFYGIVGKSSAIGSLISKIKLIAPTDVPILIQGESGTGKELLATVIHGLSLQKSHRFLALNCSSMQESLLESELFGHRKGAFTGAATNKKGLLEAVGEGTLFLDETSDLPQNIQPKFLRVLQNRNFIPLGATDELPFKGRILTASNRNLWQMVQNGLFREDLYYRISTVILSIPPLRERQEDIPLLASHFLSFYSQKHNKSRMCFSLKAMEKLISYTWPGNIRELAGVVERSIIFSKGEEINDLELSPDENTPSLKGTLINTEREIILDALRRTNWNRKKASEILKLHPVTLWKKMKALDIQKEDDTS